MLRKNGVNCKSVVSRGIPYIKVYGKGSFFIGAGLKLNNNFEGNIIGRQQRCIFIVKGKLTIGNDVGISSSAIVCHEAITIGNNVLIGGNTVIYDTDFHSLNYLDRAAKPEIVTNVQTSPVVIGDNVFIGGHSLILKGVNIGNNSIIGAGSVVTRNVPENEIWAGNPAKKIKEVQQIS